MTWTNNVFLEYKSGIIMAGFEFLYSFKSQTLFELEAFNGRRDMLKLRYKSLQFMFRIT